MTGEITPDVAIRLKKLTKTYGSGNGTVTAVKSTTLDIFKNEFFTLLGPSGCGKTTLLRLIGGFEYPTTGTILLDGQDIAEVPPFRRPINTVFQNYALFPHMTVAENIGFGLRMLKRPRDEIAARVDEMLKLVRLENLSGRRTGQISGGQQQRVALARALASEPKVLLLDESLSALDYKLRKEMQMELKSLQAATGITFIFVTHDQEEALTMSDRVAVLSSGEIMQIGSPHEVYNRPANRFVANFVGETNFLQGRGLNPDARGTMIDLQGIGAVAIPTKDTVAPGALVHIVVRPEHLRIFPLSHEPASQLTGSVKMVSFCGPETQYTVELSNGSGLLLVRKYNTPDENPSIAIGDDVSVRFTPNTAQVLPG
ncbi:MULTISPECIES: ABC transporter ATP-binding protein [Rhizobium]|uniref:Spermidine/putrescine import ATP-binding protein PotA n=1 Tax=Rhizobium tropici TaxID=398 RepID=A0A6P1C9P5_RHITR|nr:MULTISPECIES: ABC transporter ATP-binding protein [Rhizobium]AGB74050.1 putative spermidine/putrescine ABC transporter, ATP-binding protein [Rhizobium tropici CIAT 899]MBB4240538.1 spermidine/putrescine transport system ATP-binding protein [Rhizobium tropici]MBB5592046.1 spermidine/putrescine transport system ATP-binding protein [Rhizobium tropici]MBB6491100.1 spermidine/putrescine transport system ATP-binding protein [Rhizobium tropici]NEV13116.1 ABC transporter ATP-binding protein [Rhizob